MWTHAQTEQLTLLRGSGRQKRKHVTAEIIWFGSVLRTPAFEKYITFSFYKSLLLSTPAHHLPNTYSHPTDEKTHTAFGCDRVISTSCDAVSWICGENSVDNTEIISLLLSRAYWCQGLFCSSHCPTREQHGATEKAGKGHRWDSWPQWTQGLFHTIQHHGQQ